MRRNQRQMSLVQFACVAACTLVGLAATAWAQPAQAPASRQRPNILVMFGDDVGY